MLYEVITLCFSVYAIRNKVIQLTGETDSTAMGQVTAMRKVHTEHFIARLQRGKINRHIRLGAGMRLNIDIFSVKKFFSAFNSESLNLICKVTTAIIS